MSTKLYNGLRLLDNKADLFVVIPKIAEVIREEFGKAAQALVGEELARAADSKKFREDAKPEATLWFEVEEEWRKRQQKWGPHHRLNDPLRFSIVFGRSGRGNILANWYGENQGYEVALKGTGLFEDYSHWDNSDRPDGTTQKQWAQRGKEWDSLLDKYGAFGSLPLWELGSSSDPWRHMFLQSPANEDLNLYRSREDRREDALADAVLEALTGNDKIENILVHYSKAKRIVKNFLKNDESEDIPLPDFLPADFMVKIGELPPLYEVPSDLVRRIIASAE